MPMPTAEAEHAQRVRNGQCSTWGSNAGVISEEGLK